MTIQDVKEYIIPNNFGATIYQDKPQIYWSNGVRYACESDPNTWMVYIHRALKQLDANDYGGFYDLDETPMPGKEHYICPSPFGCDLQTGLILHKERNYIVIYFQFER